MMAERNAAARAAGLIAEAAGLIVCAGAGMGVDSGLPDFRGNEGFWRAYPALGRAGLRFEEIASPAAFRRDPELAWGFYGHRLALYRATKPHAGFALLLRLAERLTHGAYVFTSNVDGHFQRAGFAEERVVECHGSIHYLQCLDRCCATLWPADDFQPQVDAARCRLRNAPPRCPHCGALARPAILMFGDWEWSDERERAQSGRFADWRRRLESPVVVEIGAGTAIATVRSCAERLGGPLIRINPREWQVERAADVGIASGALAGIEAISAALAAQS